MNAKDVEHSSLVDGVNALILKLRVVHVDTVL